LAGSDDNNCPRVSLLEVVPVFSVSPSPGRPMFQVLVLMRHAFKLKFPW